MTFRYLAYRTIKQYQTVSIFARGVLDTLPATPSPEGLAALRQRIDVRLKAGARLSTLAREMGVGDQSLRAFWANPERVPYEETWELFRSWWDAERYRSRMVTQSPNSVREGTPPAYGSPLGDPSWQLVMKTMVAQSKLVADLAEKTREAQEPVIRFLEQLDEMYKRPASAPAPADEPVTPSQAVADMNAATQEEMAAREAKASRRRKGTG